MVLETNVNNMKMPSSIFNTPLKEKRTQSNKQKIKNLVKSEQESKDEYIPKNFSQLKTIKLKKYGVEFMVLYVNEGITKSAYCKRKKISPQTLNDALALNGVDYYVHENKKDKNKQKEEKGTNNKQNKTRGDTAETSTTSAIDGEISATYGEERRGRGRPKKNIGDKKDTILIAGDYDVKELDNSHNFFQNTTEVTE